MFHNLESRFLKKQKNNNANLDNKVMSRKFLIDIDFQVRNNLIYYIANN